MMTTQQCRRCVCTNPSTRTLAMPYCSGAGRAPPPAEVDDATEEGPGSAASSRALSHSAWQAWCGGPSSAPLFHAAQPAAGPTECKPHLPSSPEADGTRRHHDLYVIPVGSPAQASLNPAATSHAVPRSPTQTWAVRPPQFSPHTEERGSDAVAMRRRPAQGHSMSATRSNALAPGTARHGWARLGAPSQPSGGASCAAGAGAVVATAASAVDSEREAALARAPAGVAMSRIRIVGACQRLTAAALQPHAAAGLFASDSSRPEGSAASTAAARGTAAATAAPAAGCAGGGGGLAAQPRKHSCPRERGVR